MTADPGLFSAMPPWCRHGHGLDEDSLPRLARRIGQPHVHTDLLTTHLRPISTTTATRGRQRSQIGGLRSFGMSCGSPGFAPDETEMPALEAEITVDLDSPHVVS
jgi:hypothetical protein